MPTYTNRLRENDPFAEMYGVFSKDMAEQALNAYNYMNQIIRQKQASAFRDLIRETKEQNNSFQNMRMPSLDFSKYPVWEDKRNKTVSGLEVPLVKNSQPSSYEWSGVPFPVKPLKTPTGNPLMKILGTKDADTMKPEVDKEMSDWASNLVDLFERQNDPMLNYWSKINQIKGSNEYTGLPTAALFAGMEGRPSDESLGLKLTPDDIEAIRKSILGYPDTRRKIQDIAEEDLHQRDLRGQHENTKRIIDKYADVVTAYQQGIVNIDPTTGQMTFPTDWTKDKREDFRNRMTKFQKELGPLRRELFTQLYEKGGWNYKELHRLENLIPLSLANAGRPTSSKSGSTALKTFSYIDESGNAIPIPESAYEQDKKDSNYINPKNLINNWQIVFKDKKTGKELYTYRIDPKEGYFLQVKKQDDGTWKPVGDKVTIEDIKNDINNAENTGREPHSTIVTDAPKLDFGTRNIKMTRYRDILGFLRAAQTGNIMDFDNLFNDIYKVDPKFGQIVMEDLGKIDPNTGMTTGANRRTEHYSKIPKYKKIIRDIPGNE